MGSKASTSRRRSGWQQWPIALVVVTVAGVSWYGVSKGHWFTQAAQAPIEGARVERGPLRISVIARGDLRAADSVSLRSEVEGRTTILSLAPEGTHVKQGDLVCELDATQLVEKRFQQDIAVSNAEAAFIKAKQNFEIQESQNNSDIAQAKQKLEFAQQDLTKFLEGERASELEKSKQAIDLAKEEAARAQDKLSWSQKLAEKGFLTQSELEADRLAGHRADVVLQQATRDLELLERFQMPRKESELRGALEEAQRERERVELQAKAHIVDFEADVRTNQAKFDLEKEKLVKLTGQIAKARLLAPRAGLLVYAQRDSDEPPIQEGTEVREREEICSIPSAEGMIAQAKLHESVLDKIRIGQGCTIKVDALQGAEFEGKVSFVAVLPDQTSRWMNPNTRLYRTDLAIAAGSEGMRPGMSCAIEILVEILPDAIHVPVQSVFRREQENVCFVPRNGVTESRPVVVGRYNDKWVQILSGLAEGETVLLSPPPGFSVKPEQPASQEEEPREKAGGKTPEKSTGEHGAATSN